MALNEKYFTVKEVAEMTKLKESTIQRWIRQGKIKATRLWKEYRISEEEVKKLFEEN